MVLCSSMVTMASVAVSATTRKSWAGCGNPLLEGTGLAALSFLGFDIAVLSPVTCRRKLYTHVQFREASQPAAAVDCDECSITIWNLGGCQERLAQLANNWTSDEYCWPFPSLVPNAQFNWVSVAVTCPTPN